jgi:hypothetical protein
MAPDGGGWTMSGAIGPSLEFEPHSYGMSSAVEGRVPEIRVVVSCFGGHSVHVTVASGKQISVPAGSFTAACEPDRALTSSMTFRLPTAGFDVTAMPDSKMWLVVTVQERAAANPAP